MARPARFDDDVILQAALCVVQAHGPTGLTTDAVAQQMGGHVGSIYYRFPTKDHLLARLWIRAARAGQSGALSALRHADLNTAVEHAVLHYPRWARSNPAQAQVLAAYGREQLIRHVPDDLAARYAEVLDSVVNDREEVVVTRSGHEPVVIVSLDEFEALRETAYLMRSPRNARRLLDAMERLEAAEGEVHDLLADD